MRITCLVYSCLLLICCAFSSGHCQDCVLSGRFHQGRGAPVISGLTYDSITTTSLTVFWTTDLPADSKVRFMATDSNYQPLLFTDSVADTQQVTAHTIFIGNLQPSIIYRYIASSENESGMAFDTGYFVTGSFSSGATQVYFNHSVDTSVSTGEYAKGNQNFEKLLIRMIDSAKYSIDITLWSFEYYLSVARALIGAKNRGVKIRFVYNHTANTPVLDTLAAYGILVLKRNFDTLHSMHNKFWIFDGRCNSDPTRKYLWTGSTNVTHAQFHSDRNNVIVVQDASLCAVYTTEFEEMWGSHEDLPDPSRARFGTKKINNVPHILNVAGRRMEVYFSPSDSVAAFLRGLISAKTTRSLYFCMLKFELPCIEDTLHAIFNEGMNLEGVFDSSCCILPGSAWPRMKGLNVPNAWNPPASVFIDTIPGLIHHKYFITDASYQGGNKITSTGSFNWEVPGDQANDENSLTIFDPRINNLYFQEFSMRYRESGGEVFQNQGLDPGAGQAMPFFMVFPNPAASIVTFRYNIPEACKVTLCIADLYGRPWAVMVDEIQETGPHEAVWNATGLPDGVYIVSLKSSRPAMNRKLVIQR